MAFLLKSLYPPHSYPTQVEIRALLLCAQKELNSSQADCLRSLFTASFDWEHFNNLAINHRICPVVYTNLDRYGADLVPMSVLTNFKAYFDQNLMFNLLMQSEIARVYQKARARGIKLILLKGPVLANQVYGSLALREYKDIDILARTPDLDEIRAVLKDMGYQRSMNTESINPESAHTHESHRHERFDVEIELHWTLNTALIPFVVVEDPAYWDNLRALEIEHETSYTLPQDDQFLMLCMHGTRHRWHRIKWLCDIREYVLAYPDFDWAALLEKATQLRLRRVVLLSFWLINWLFETPLPPVVAAALDGNRRIRRLGYYISEWIFDQQHVGFHNQMRALLFFGLLQEWTLDRVVYAVYILRQRRKLSSNLILIGAGVGVLGILALVIGLVIRLVIG